MPDEVDVVGLVAVGHVVSKMSHITHFEELSRREEELKKVKNKVQLKKKNNNSNTPARTPRALSEVRASVLDLCATPGAPATAATPGSRFFSRHRPYSRRVTFQPDFEAALEAGDEDDGDSNAEQDEEVQQVCGRSWQVCRLSPLFGLKYNKDFLDAWERVLLRDMTAARERDKKNVESVHPEHVGDEEEEEGLARYGKFKVEVKQAPGLRMTATDSRAIKVCTVTVLYCIHRSRS